ncbi:MAG: ankyrin repeat domain-containing protein [Alphaproteobacteria bacterium]|nr:ankyrin repeat domain-containing protein [Alphaproteobacteria bacterium]
MPNRDDVLNIILRSGSQNDLKKLLDQGALKQAGKSVDCLLIMAILWNNKEAVKLLLDYGEDIDLYEKDKETPLEFAVRHGLKEMVQLLLDRGADINLSSSNEHLVFQCANGFNNGEMLTLLLKKGLDVHVPNIHDVVYRAIGPNEENFDLLLQNGICLDKEHKGYKTLFSHAWLYKQTAKLKNRALVFKEYNDKKGLQPLSPFQKFFGKKGKRELFEAVQTGDVSSLDQIFKNPKNNMDDQLKLELLYEAIRRNQSVVVAVLLEAGAPLTDLNNLQSSPLFASVIWGRSYIAKMLIEKKADVNFQTKNNGYTPLLAAVTNGSVQMMNDLIQAGANINQGGFKITPLMASVQLKRFKHFKCLLEKEAIDLNKQDEYGKTALMMAIENGFMAAGFELIEKGADVLIKDKEGNDVYQLAMKMGQKEIADMIKKRVSDILRERKKAKIVAKKPQPIHLLSGQGANVSLLDFDRQKD